MEKQSILTSLQRDFLVTFGKSPYKDMFYLTGGTALAEYYLKHRYSDDLDFFTSLETSFAELPSVLLTMAGEIDASVEIARKFEQYLRATIIRGNERILTDWAYDTPVRLAQLNHDQHKNIYYDSLLDLGANKISAIYGRASSKDFVDLFFLNKNGYSFEMLYEKSKEKHEGLDNYWMSIALSQINKIEKLPKMIETVTVEALRDHFLVIAKILAPNDSLDHNSD